jgi:hypothetical protein
LKKYQVSSVLGVDICANHLASARHLFNNEGCIISTRLLSASQAVDSLSNEECSRLTKVLCLDSAYHFRSRTAFLCRLSSALSPPLSLGLVDLIITRSFQRRLLRSFWLRALSRLACWLCQVPYENLVTSIEYVRALERSGFERVSLLDITENVLDGFVHFSKRQGAFLETLGLASAGGFAKFSATGRLLALLRRHDVLRAVLVRAELRRGDNARY